MRALVLPFAAVLVAACQFGPGTTTGPAPATPLSTAQGVPTTAPGGSSPVSGGATLPFADDFADPSSGWGTGSAPDLAYQIQYVDGGLAILLNKPTTAYSRLGFAPATGTLMVAVDAQRIAGRPEGGTYGPTCNVDGQNFYAFYVGDDGRHGIVRVEDGVEAILERQPAGSALPLKAGEPNMIGALCSTAAGGAVDLRLYVNGEEPVLVAEDAQPLGDAFAAFGLGAANDEETQFVVQFDDFAAQSGG